MSSANTSYNGGGDAVRQDAAKLIVVMGAAGCGKSSVGLALAQVLHCGFIDADDLHPKENVEKMAHGHPLTDADRTPWLEKVRRTARLILSPQGQARTREISQHSLESSQTSSTPNSASPILSEDLEAAISIIHPGALHPPHLDQKQLEPIDWRRNLVVVACSALKLSYRELIRGKENEEVAKDSEDVETFFIFLRGTRPLLLKRMQNREHFMKPEMLDSQLVTLEIPNPDTEANILVVQLGKGEEKSEERGMEAVVEETLRQVRLLLGF